METLLPHIVMERIVFHAQDPLIGTIGVYTAFVITLFSTRCSHRFQGSYFESADISIYRTSRIFQATSLRGNPLCGDACRMSWFHWAYYSYRFLSRNELIDPQACLLHTCRPCHGACSGTSSCSAIESGSNGVSHAVGFVLISSGIAIACAPGPLKSSDSGRLPCLACFSPGSSHSGCIRSQSVLQPRMLMGQVTLRTRCALVISPAVVHTPTPQLASLWEVPSHAIFQPGHALPCAPSGRTVGLPSAVQSPEDADVTIARDVAARKTTRFPCGLNFFFVGVASGFEDLVAPHTFFEDLLHLVADLSTDSQKAFEAHKLWPHDLHHPLRVDECALEDSLVDGDSQVLW